MFIWVKPVVSEESLFLLGRMARGGANGCVPECKDRLSAKFTPRQPCRTGMGSRVICRDRQLIYEEAPQAYKSIDSALRDCLADAGPINTPVARLRPVPTCAETQGRKAHDLTATFACRTRRGVVWR